MIDMILYKNKFSVNFSNCLCLMIFCMRLIKTAEKNKLHFIFLRYELNRKKKKNVRLNYHEVM